ncbi:MAG TPA: 3-phosphoshikimate 1-carboxyvinyltransferase [Verrucomicrobiales bacterium]|nr:3-phosphoshikimate 1-carboxyvinyltransferase [Verrucomicrobiales bacterium]
MGSEWVVRPARHLPESLRVPGDKSISHRAMMLAGLGEGDCLLTGFLRSEDCLATQSAMEELGAKVEADQTGPETLRVRGVAMRPREPAREIDCGNSGTTMRLLAGILAAQRFCSRLVGDASLSRRPMGRVLEPLRAMGARIEAEGAGGCAPLVLGGGHPQAICYALPVASAQVKSCVLLAGLFCEGKTMVVEPVATRDHTERMLRAFGVPVARDGKMVWLEGPARLRRERFVIPGDVSSAAFWLTAAAAWGRGTLSLPNVGLNPTRTGVIDLLRRMGASIRESNRRGEEDEPAGELTVEGGALRGVIIEGETIPNVIDELPVLAVAGALAEGETEIRDAGELRVKESDRIHAVTTNLRAMGAEVEERREGLRVRGGGKLHGAVVESFGDHRIAMAFAVAGLFAEGETVIRDVACVATSYPGFAADLGAFWGDQERSGLRR